MAIARKSGLRWHHRNGAGRVLSLKIDDDAQLASRTRGNAVQTSDQGHHGAFAQELDTDLYKLASSWLRLLSLSEPFQTQFRSSTPSGGRHISKAIEQSITVALH